MISSQRPKAVAAGLAAAVVFAIICLVFALWNPAAALVPLVVFMVVIAGILKGRRWSAYGGALFILALAGVAMVGLARLGVLGQLCVAIAFGATVFVFAAWLLFRAGRSLPALPAIVSRRIWIGLAVVVFLSPNLMRAYVITHGSEENTLLVGDQILVRPLAGAPERGELVTFRYPVDPGQIFVKRVVAVGGDRLRLENKRFILNAAPVEEPYAVHKTAYVDAFRDNFPSRPNAPVPDAWQLELKRDTVNGELVVPPGKFFVLGDNRDNSLDSRYWGFLEAKDFVGTPMMIYFSTEATPGQLLQGPYASAPVLLHPSLIRWSRIFKVL